MYSWINTGKLSPDRRDWIPGLAIEVEEKIQDSWVTIVPFSGGEIRRLTHLDEPINASSPWSPNGQHIAYILHERPNTPFIVKSFEDEGHRFLNINNPLATRQQWIAILANYLESIYKFYEAW